MDPIRFRRLSSGLSCEVTGSDRTPNPYEVVCSTECAEPPLAWIVHFPCNYYTNDEFHELIAPKCMFLLKDCFVGDTWSARASIPYGEHQFGSMDGCPSGISDEFQPFEGLFYPIWGYPPYRFGDYPNGCLEDLPFSWDGGSWDYNHASWIWDLSGVPNLTYKSINSGASAQYVLETPLECDGVGVDGMTLIKTSDTEATRHLPCRLAIFAQELGDAFPLACDTREHQCNCADPGFETINFAYDLTGGCDGLAWPDGSGDLIRTTADALEASYSGVSIGAAPCGAFAKQISVGGCDKSVLLVHYCDGTDWTTDFYCLISGNWELQGSIVGATICCSKIKIEGTVPELECCCTSCIQDCPDFDTENPTLNVSFYAPGCGTIDGCVQEISNGGSGYTWDATSTSCFSTTTLSKDGANCWKLTLGAAECISATYDAVSVTCDPPEIAFEFTFTPEGTGCCGGATTSVTATVTL